MKLKRKIKRYYKKANKMKLTVWGMFLITLVLYGVNVYLQNDYVTKGIDLERIRVESEKLDLENLELRKQVLQAQALTTIHDKAVSEGFVNGDPLYLWGREVKK